MVLDLNNAIVIKQSQLMMKNRNGDNVYQSEKTKTPFFFPTLQIALAGDSVPTYSGLQDASCEAK